MPPALVYSVHLGLSIDDDYTARQKREACSVPLALGVASLYGVLPDPKESKFLRMLNAGSEIFTDSIIISL